MRACVRADVLPAPTNVQLHRISSTAVEVSWDRPLYQQVQGYRVYYHTSPSADPGDWQSVEIGPYTVTEVGGLAPNALYAFRVRAKAADNRYGNFSRAVMLPRRDAGTSPHPVHAYTSPYRTHTHTHTHTFNGPLSGTTWVSRYQKGKTNLDFTEARDSE